MRALLIAVVVLMGCGEARAQFDPTPDREKQRGKMIDACKGKPVGSACKVATIEGELAGTCTEFSDRSIQCMPNVVVERMKKAREACDQKAPGDPCTWRPADKEIKGKCVRTAGGLSCQPTRG